LTASWARIASVIASRTGIRYGKALVPAETHNAKNVSPVIASARRKTKRR
jgi:hypothetical protein